MKRMSFALLVVLLAAAAWATGASADAAPAPAPETQTAGQIATSQQSADATAASAQVAPQNTNVNVRVLSPGGNGPVTQANSSTAGALAGNVNLTGQQIGQADGTSQQAGQAAESGQDASAAADSAQVKPQNTNVDVRVLSPGDDGPVSQANTSTAGAVAANLNGTGQSIDQTAGGPGAQQVAGQEAGNWQGASATAGSLQVEPSNTNVGVRVLSPGSDGGVSQANTSTAVGAAANANLTKQSIDQASGGPSPWLGSSHDGGVGVQAAGQQAANKQDAAACATSVQVKPENTNLSGGGASQSNTSTAVGLAGNLNGLGQTIDQGSSSKPGIRTSDAPAQQAVPAPAMPADTVSQSNTSTALALSANLNLTHQSITQQQGGHPSGVNVQAAGQAAGNEQHATSSATSLQLAPSNTNGGIGIAIPACPKPAPPICAPLRRAEVVPVT